MGRRATQGLLGQAERFESTRREAGSAGVGEEARLSSAARDSWRETIAHVTVQLFCPVWMVIK